MWTACPFYPDVSLEVITPSPSQIEIEVLNLSSTFNNRLNEAGITNLKNILDCNISGLKQIYQIGDIRAKNIYYATKEYIDDNL